MDNRATLSEMRARVLDRVNMTGSSYPVTKHVDYEINRGVQSLYNLLVNSYEDYFHKELSFNLVGGQEEYDLPEDYLKTVKVFYLESTAGNRRYSVRRFTVDEIDGYRKGPLSSGIIEHWYVPALPILREDDDKVPKELFKTFEDYAILHAAEYLMKRERDDYRPFLEEKAMLKDEIVNTIEPRDTGEPKEVSDIYGRWSNPRWSLRNGRDFKYRIMGDKLKITEFGTLGA